MTYKLRNTIALAVVLLLFSGGGAFWYFFWQPRELNALTKQITSIDKELDNLPILTEEVQRLTVQFQDVKRRYDSRSKEIPEFDVSSQTYGYMSRGIDVAGFLKFDMKFLGTQEGQGYGFNAYKLELGEAQFDNLYRFVYFLENGRRLYKISTLALEYKDAVDTETKETKKWIAFEMELHAYYVRGIPELGTSLAARSLTVVPAPFDPFDPLIVPTIAAEAPLGELNPRNLEVKAVLPGKAFVLYENELIVLQLGDRVWRGAVSAIDPRSSTVEFTLNEGGVITKVSKQIQFDRRRRLR